MAADSYNFQDVIKGDSFKGAKFTFTYDSGAAIDLSSAIVRMQFRYRRLTGMPVKTITSEDGLTVVDNSVEIPNFIVDFQVGVYFYDIEIEFAEDDISTWVYGTLKVLQDVTNVNHY